MHRDARGQSTLEYIVIFAAIVAVIVVIAYTTIRPSIVKMMGAAATRINNSSESFTSGCWTR